MKRSIQKLTAAAVSALFLFAGCAKADPQAQTLRVGVMYSSDIIPLAIVQEQGLDKEAGFTLDMQVFSSAKDRDAALQAGELDAVFTDYVGMCIYSNAGLNVKVTGVTDGDYQLVAGKDSGIASLEDAAGKSVAISENTLIEYALDYVLAENGKDASYLKKEVVPRIPDRLEMLRGGKVDLALLPDPFATLALESGAVRLDSANARGLYPAVSAFTQTAIEKKAKAIQAYYKAYDKAVDYLNSTPLEQYEDAVISRAGYPEELKGKIVLPEFRKNRLPEAAELSRAIEWAAGKGLCADTLKPGDLLGKL